MLFCFPCWPICIWSRLYISKFARVCTYKDNHWKSSCWFWDRRSVRTLLLLMSGDKLRPCSHCVPWDPADVSFVSHSMHISGSPDYMKLTCCAALSFVLQNFVHESWSNLSNCMSFYAMVWCVCRSCEEEEPEEGPAGWWWWWRRGLSWTVPIPKHLCDSYQVACVIEQAWMDSSASSLNVDLRVKLCQILSWQDVQDFRLFCAICWCLIKINLATWRIFLCDVWTVAVRMWHQCMLLLMSVCTFVFPLLLSIFFVPVLYRLTENYHFVQNT